MRATRTILTAVTAIAVVIVVPGSASANGGAYLELDETHYLPGDRGTAVAYVQVPRRRESILDRGPFYLYALSGRGVLEEGEPFPMGAVRIGTFSIEEEKHQQYELRADFTAPHLTGDFYTLGVCNDPCTISGFRESLSGTISIVATQREADLLTQNARLRRRAFSAAADARRTDRKLEAAQADLQLQVESNQDERDLLTSRIDSLERSLAAAERRATDAARPPFDPWVVGAIGALVVAAGVLTFRRRRLLAAVSELR